ncbi:MAG: lipid A biosynthesis acyltransferase [Acidiferrobacterales bacterium]
MRSAPAHKKIGVSRLLYAAHSRSPYDSILVSRKHTSTKAERLPESTGEAEFYVPQLKREYFSRRYWSTWLTVGLLRLCVPLPMRASRSIGALLGLIFFLVNRKRRRIARRNLRLCFQELSGRERARLLRKHFLMMGRSYVDLGFLAWASLERIERKIRFVGLDDALPHREKHIITLVPHCLGVSFGAILAKYHPAFSMFKPPRDPVLNWFLSKGRVRFGCRLLARKQGMRPVVRALQEGMAFYYIPDEDLGPRRSVFVPFFGVQTATLPTLGRLAELTDAVVMPVFVRMLPGGEGYEIQLKPVLENFPSGDRIKDAARMNAVLEQGIREMPEQYMWTFKLFRTRPHDAPSPYN